MPPTLALFAGDPVGIGPEIVAKVIAAPESLPPAQLHIIGQRASIEAGAQAAGVSLNLDTIALRERGPVNVIEWPGWNTPLFPPGDAGRANGALQLSGLRLALDLARQRLIDAVCFAPVNVAALRAGGMAFDDELHFSADLFDCRDRCALVHVLDNIWTSQVNRKGNGPNGSFTAEGVVDAIAVLAEVLRRAGKLNARIGVCEPEPNGDNASGENEVEILQAGMRLAVSRGYAAEGPFPTDSVFPRARNGTIDGVVTMQPEQEPIAMTLMGFERAVTVLSGLPAAVTTTAHGTAYDIVGRGIANPWALRNAMAVALRIASG